MDAPIGFMDMYPAAEERKMPNAMHRELNDLEERLNQALSSLESARYDLSEEVTHSHRVRGKIEGVKLALSYVQETQRGRRFQ